MGDLKYSQCVSTHRNYGTLNDFVSAYKPVDAQPAPEERLGFHLHVSQVEGCFH
ncbi:UNVERIFIED_CONTAM: hypothetical protein FKN15_052474 [Acipenser sinensis]